MVYAELRFSPFLGGDLPADQYVDGVVSGLERGQKDFGIKMRVILAFMREQPGVSVCVCVCVCVYV